MTIISFYFLIFSALILISGTLFQIIRISMHTNDILSTIIKLIIMPAYSMTGNLPVLPLHPQGLQYEEDTQHGNDPAHPS